MLLTALIRRLGLDEVGRVLLPDDAFRVAVGISPGHAGVGRKLRCIRQVLHGGRGEEPGIAGEEPDVGNLGAGQLGPGALEPCLRGRPAVVGVLVGEDESGNAVLEVDRRCLGEGREPPPVEGRRLRQGTRSPAGWCR